MTQKDIISAFFAVSGRAVLFLPFMSLSAFAAPTTIAPVETHPLKPLYVPPQAKNSILSPSQKTAEAEAPASIISFSRPRHVSAQTEKSVPQTKINTASDETEEARENAVVEKFSLIKKEITPNIEAHEVAAEPAEILAPSKPVSAPVTVPVTENLAKSAVAPVPAVPAPSEAVAVEKAPVPISKALPKDQPLQKPSFRKTPAFVHASLLPPSSHPAVHPVARPAVRPAAHPSVSPAVRPSVSVPVKPVVAAKAVSGFGPDQFDLGGVRLGMDFNQARLAIAKNLGIPLRKIEVFGSQPEAETCTPDTQLSGEGNNGAINVQFTCNVGLPLHHELSVNRIVYEPSTGLIESVLSKAVAKYGKPVNLSDYNPLQADYVSYDWCRSPAKGHDALAAGKTLYCPAKKGSYLRLQGRDNALEFELSGTVGATEDFEV